jgi:pseudouridine-5'-phosphate glycosidase
VLAIRDGGQGGNAVRLSEEVAEALRAGRPVVALESTLVAQGLPWPENWETARRAEAAVRAAGAVPATVAVVEGRPTVGLGPAELEAVARSGTYGKVGRRELAWAVGGRRNAATTVSATLYLARRSGVTVMATGGLGGVHRDAAASHDVSADLDELARADGCLVVCSGVKSILDVGGTLERLETLGVAVAAYRTHGWPGFLSVESGWEVEARWETPAEVAGWVAAHRWLGLPGALVLGQAVAEGVGVPREELDAVIEEAQERARGEKVKGKAVTPFLLKVIREATAGRSLKANEELIVANAGLAGEVAVALKAVEADLVG